MLAQHRLFTILLPLFLGFVSGCSSTPPEPPAEDPTAGRLRKIGLAYMEVHNNTGKPPQNVNQIKDALKQMGESDPDSLLISPRDGKPFTIILSVDTRKGGEAPNSDAPPVVLAYEQVGKDGNRYILTTLCFAIPLSADDFAKAKFPAGHIPH